MTDARHDEPGSRLVALAATLPRLGGVWVSVRPRPFGRGALATFWFPNRRDADTFAATVPWESSSSRHLRRVTDTTYNGWQVRVTVPVAEVDAARRILRRRALPGPTEELEA